MAPKLDHHHHHYHQNNTIISTVVIWNERKMKIVTLNFAIDLPKIVEVENSTEKIVKCVLLYFNFDFRLLWIPASAHRHAQRESDGCQANGWENVSFHFTKCLMHFKASGTSTVIIFVFHFAHFLWIQWVFVSAFFWCPISVFSCAIHYLFSYFNLKLELGALWQRCSICLMMTIFLCPLSEADEESSLYTF